MSLYDKIIFEMASLQTNNPHNCSNYYKTDSKYDFFNDKIRQHVFTITCIIEVCSEETVCLYDSLRNPKMCDLFNMFKDK